MNRVIVVVLTMGMSATAWGQAATDTPGLAAPLGRCCFLGIVPEPVLCQVTTKAECFNFAAPVSWTPGADCEGDPCNEPPKGRCCFLGIVPEPVLCQVMTKEECFALPAPVSWTEGANCLGDPCNEPPKGRCCFLGIVPEPVLCQVTTEEACFNFAAPVSWTEGEDCTGDPCNERTFSGCGVLAIGPQGCVLIHTDDGQTFAVSNLGGFNLGDRVWVSGTINPNSFACFPVPIPELENNTIGKCFDDCGVLVQGVECVLFQADSGGLFVLENLGGFQVGDRVQVNGCLNPFCFTICQQGNGCIEDNTIEPCGEPLGRCCFLGIVPEPVLCEVTTKQECDAFAAPVSWTLGEDCEGDPCNEPEHFSGCGTISIGQQRCLLFTSEDGRTFALENTGALIPGLRVWVSGTINPNSQLCFPVIRPAIEDNTIGKCFSRCGRLVQGVECVLFQANSGGLFILENLGGFQVGDAVKVKGCFNSNCITFCQQGNGCVEDNTIEPATPVTCLQVSIDVVELTP